MDVIRGKTIELEESLGLVDGAESRDRDSCPWSVGRLGELVLKDLLEGGVTSTVLQRQFKEFNKNANSIALNPIELPT